MGFFGDLFAAIVSPFTAIYKFGDDLKHHSFGESIGKFASREFFAPNATIGAFTEIKPIHSLLDSKGFNSLTFNIGKDINKTNDFAVRAEQQDFALSDARDAFNANLKAGGKGLAAYLSAGIAPAAAGIWGGVTAASAGYAGAATANSAFKAAEAGDASGIISGAAAAGNLAGEGPDLTALTNTVATVNTAASQARDAAGVATGAATAASGLVDNVKRNTPASVSGYSSNQSSSPLAPVQAGISPLLLVGTAVLLIGIRSKK